MRWKIPHPLVIAFGFLIGNLSAPANQPNVLIIIADDLGWGDLNSHGNRDIETPHLDALKEEGLSFEKLYSCPVGSTSSASLLTGRYHYRTGVVGERASESVMYSSETTLGELFLKNGYRTGLFGRWHHGLNWPHNPEAQGFTTYTNPESPVDDAIAFIEAKKDPPFFCMLYSPYPSLNKSEAEQSPDRRLPLIHQKIEKLDSETGNLIAALEESGLRKNTILLFLSDNGPDQFGETRGRYNNYFYGGKGSVHEGGVRVPCFISWSGKIEAGSRFTRITSLIDWYPTLADLCELDPVERQLPVDGSSLSPILQNGGNSRGWPNRILFTSWTPPGYAIKKASYSARSDRWVAIRDPRWRRDKTVVEKSSGWELYDINTDPFQSHDMGDEHPFLLSELKADCIHWLDQTTDDGVGPIPTQIGHPESPVVTLEDNEEQRWPVTIIKPGNYRITATYSGEITRCEISAGEKRIQLPGTGNIYLGEDIKEIRLISGDIISLQLNRDSS